MTPEEKTFKENWNTPCDWTVAHKDFKLDVKAAPKFMGKALDFASKPERFFLYAGMLLTAWTFLTILFTVLAVA